jgi:hypothetical protein
MVNLLGDAQPARERDQVARDGGGLLGRDPPADSVVSGVPVGVLGGQLGLANPAQPVQHPRRPGVGILPGRVVRGAGGQGGDGHRAGRRRTELLVQAVQQVSAAGEGQVARGQVGDRPGRRRRRRWVGWAGSA